MGNFGYGVVEDTNDPDKAGGYRIRIEDRMKGLSTEDLPWARQMTHTASHQKVGKSPTRLIKGSRVMVCYSDPGENMVIMGSVDTSGLSKSGKTLDGSPDIDKQYNSLPPVCTGAPNADVQHYFVGRQPDTPEQTPDVMLKTPVGES